MDMEFFVLEGEAVFTVGEEESVAKAGALVAGPKDISHGIRNPGHIPLKILAIKNP
jgi:mannose-6-phosphate isomerase-like protein (cupin superfamily)